MTTVKGHYRKKHGKREFIDISVPQSASTPPSKLRIYDDNPNWRWYKQIYGKDRYKRILEGK